MNERPEHPAGAGLPGIANSCPACGSMDHKRYTMEAGVLVDGELVNMSGLSVSLCARCGCEYETIEQGIHNGMIHEQATRIRNPWNE